MHAPPIAIPMKLRVEAYSLPHQLDWALAIVMLSSVMAVLMLAATLVFLARRGTVPWNRIHPVRISPDRLFLALCVVLLSIGVPGGLWLVALVGVPWLFRREGIDPRVQFGAGRFPLVRLGAFGIWLYLVANALIAPVGFVSDQLFLKLGYEPVAQSAVSAFLAADTRTKLGVFIVAAVAIAPMAEEMLFRGFLQPLLKARFGSWPALLLTAFFFAGSHFHAFSFFQLFVLGGLLGAAYEATGSLPLCVAVHMIFNAATIVGLLAVKYYG